MLPLGVKNKVFDQKVGSVMLYGEVETRTSPFGDDSTHRLNPADILRAMRHKHLVEPARLVAYAFAFLI